MTPSRPVIPPPVALLIGGPERSELYQRAVTDIPIEESAEHYKTGTTLAQIATLYRSLSYKVNPDEIRSGSSLSVFGSG